MLWQNQWKVVLCRQAPWISGFLSITLTCLPRSFLRIVKRSCIRRLQSGFVNVCIVPIGFICFTTLNGIYVRRSVRDIELKCCLEWAENESYFCPFLSRCRRSEKWPSILFFESLLSFTYINSVTHGEFYFVYYTLMSAITIVDTFSVDFRWKIIVTFSIH